MAPRSSLGSCRPADPDVQVAAPRSLLASILARVRDQQTCDELLGPALDPVRVAEALAPVAHVGSQIDWLTVNGERVDAVVTRGDVQWRVVFGTATGTTIDWLDVFERPPRFDGVRGGRALVVNGPSGAGKSVLMHAVQRLATVPFVIFDEPEHIGSVQPGYVIWRDRAPSLHRGYLAAIAALAHAGNHVAVPAAGHGQAEFTGAFSAVPTLTVGLTCEPHVLAERERRTGRWGGIAGDSLAAHDGWRYDLEFDTTDGPDPSVMARQVLVLLETLGTP